MRISSSLVTRALATVAICAAAPTWATVVSLTDQGVTYTLFESVPVLNPTTHQYSDQFTLDITGINGPTDIGGRYGVNSLAFGQPAPKGVATGSLTNFTFMMGGLNSMGCNGTGNFYCFLANTAPGSPVLPANSTLSFTFDVTLKSGDTFAGYDPDFKIQWLGTQNNYDLVSKLLAPNPVPLPATLPLLLGALAAFGLMLRRSRPAPVRRAAAPAAR